MNFFFKKNIYILKNNNMAKISIDLSKYKASGVYTLEYDNTEVPRVNPQVTRLVVGFSKKGIPNAPVYIEDIKTAKKVYGDIDRDLENKGSFFHRSLFTCLETAPCFALNLLPINNGQDENYPVDMVPYMSFSLSASEENGNKKNELYSSFFNKEGFWFPDTNYFNAIVNDDMSPNKGKIFNFVNLGQTDTTIIITKSTDLIGFDITAKEWFGQSEIPAFIKEYDYISDYFVDVYLIKGDWTNLSQLSQDSVFGEYFDLKGLKKDKFVNFINNESVTLIAKFQGSIIPDLIDNNNINYSIDTIINNNYKSTGIFCELNRSALDSYDPDDYNTSGRIDMVGHTLIQYEAEKINFLSYNINIKESLDYEENIDHSEINNKIVYDFGLTSTDNLPPKGYTASSNSYHLNQNDGVFYYTSYYGLGNNGKFNNVLNINLKYFNDSDIFEFGKIEANKSILKNDTGKYCTIISKNIIVNNNNEKILQLGISHPDKYTEGNDFYQILNTDSTSGKIVIGATTTTIAEGDWVFASNTNNIYYFRVVGVTGSTNIELSVDISTPEYFGGEYINYINNTYKLYYGSKFDAVEPSNPILTIYIEPDKFVYYSSNNYYIAYESSKLYKDFKNGLLTDGDLCYLHSEKLNVIHSFDKDQDGINILKLKYQNFDSTKDWGFDKIYDNTHSGSALNLLRIYSLVGDYSKSIEIYDINSTHTEFYVKEAYQKDFSIGQYILSDPMMTGDMSRCILTKIVSKKKIYDGTTHNGDYLIKVNQRVYTYTNNNKQYVIRYKNIDDAATSYNPFLLNGFKLTKFHLPDGTNKQLAKIYGMLDPNVSGLFNALSDRDLIVFRYIVDTFDGGLQENSFPKNYLTKLAKNRLTCMALLNAPSIKLFKESKDPRFTDEPTAANPVPILNCKYIADGGNLDLSPSFRFSLPSDEDGAKFQGMFAPFLTIKYNGKNINIPPAADVSNNFIRKFMNGHPFTIVAGPKTGVLMNPNIVGLEYNFNDSDREYLEPFGINPIVYKNGIGYMIYGNQSGYQRVLSAYNNLHVRDLLITLEENIESILHNYVFQANTSYLRMQIRALVESYLENVVSAGGIYTYQVIMNETNNTQDIIDQSFAIIDIAIEPVRGMQKIINRIHIYKTGEIKTKGFLI